MKNIRFAQTVNAKHFAARLSALLDEQYGDLSFDVSVDKIRSSFDNEDYELSLLYLSRLRKDLELFSMFLEDTQQNVSAFVGLDSAHEPAKEVQTTPTTEEAEVKQAEVVSTAAQQTVDPMEQLQQIEKLVNVVRSLKGEQS